VVTVWRCGAGHSVGLYLCTIMVGFRLGWYGISNFLLGAYGVCGGKAMAVLALEIPRPTMKLTGTRHIGVAGHRQPQ
jgi:hypothetical protein